jgi:hypothetical protein
MGLTWRDGAGTALVAGAITLYVAHTAGADLPLLSSPRALGALVFVAGMAACSVAAAVPRVPGWALTLGTALGLTSLVSAILTVALGSAVSLAVLASTIVALWLLATLRHAASRSAAGPTGPPPAEERPEQPQGSLPPHVDVRRPGRRAQSPVARP